MQKSDTNQLPAIQEQPVVAFIKFLDEELDSEYLSSLDSEQRRLLILDMQMVTEGIKKVMLTLWKGSSSK